MTFGVGVIYKTAGGVARRLSSEDYPFPVKIMGEASASRSDDFVATGNGTTVDATAAPKQNFSLTVVPTGAVTSWTVVLEGSLDGTTFTTILTHTNVTGSGVVVSTTTPVPSLYYRTRDVALTLGAGTKITSTVLAMQ